MLSPEETPLESIQRQEKEISQLERQTVVGLVKELTKPVKLEEEDIFFSTTSFVNICDHLRIDFISKEEGPELAKTGRDNLSFIEVEKDHIVTDQEINPKDTMFGPKTGDRITVIRVREDLSLAELVKLIKTIRGLTTSPLWTEEDIKKIDSWKDYIRQYSYNLRWAGLAMKKVQEEAKRKIQEKKNKENKDEEEKNEEREEENDFDKLYTKITEIVFRLGGVFNLDKRGDEETNLNDVYQEEKENTQELQQGLTYARLGETTGKTKPFTIERAVKIYQSLRRRRSDLLGIINTVITKSLPKQTERTKAETRKLSIDFAEALTEGGVEKLYQQLPVPEWVKQLVKADLPKLKITQGGLEQLIAAIDKGLGPNRVGSIIYEFLGNPAWKKYCQEKYQVKLIHLFTDPASRGDIEDLLTKYQEHLQTLGLGKDNIRRFNDWLNNPHFFDEKLKDKLRGSSPFSWESDPTITSLSQVVEHYNQALKTTDGQGIKMVLEEQARFQRAMITLIIDEMRTTYGGWVDAAFQALKDSSPSIIIEREQLNCAGRTSMLVRAAMAVGVAKENISGATYFEHIAVSIKFPNGEEMIAEPSNYFAGNELLHITKQISDTEGLLREGERVVEDDRGNRYLLTDDISQNLASRILCNFQADIEDPLSPISTFQQEISLDATDLDSFFINGRYSTSHLFIDGKLVPITIPEIAAATNKTEAEIKWMLKRLKFLCPDYCTPDGKRANGDSDWLSGADVNFQQMMRGLFKEI